MGRSGGGHRSFSSGGHHSGGGGYHHRSGGGGFHSSYHHHYYGGSYYGSRGGGWMCGICLIPLLFILCIGFVIVILLSDGTITVATTLTACEEVLVCPDSLKDGEITFSNAFSKSTAYLVKSEPPISKQIDVTTETPADENLDYGAYVYKTFNLVIGSTLYWSMDNKRSSSYNFDLYLLQGKDQLDKFIDGHGFNYLRYEYVTQHSEFNFTARETDEYAVVMEAYYGDSYITNQKYIVNHKHYDTTGLEIDKCNSCTFSVDDDDFPGQCVVVKMPCDVREEEDIKVYYNEAHNGLYYAALVIAILGGIGFAAAILLCVVCALRKAKGSSGTTYQSLATGTPVTTAPVVAAPVAPAPASYNTTPYQTPTPSYQQSAYPATAPAYTSVDPSAPPTYVPYGTAPTAY